MVRGKMYFGTKEYMQWVDCPAVGIDMGSQGWSSGGTSFLDGRADVRSSVNSHREYNLSWNMRSLDSLRPILDYADGLYGTGKIHWIDPFSSDKNVLPQNFASPVYSTMDAVNLGGELMPVRVQTPRGAAGPVRGLPINGARFSTTVLSNTPKVWIPLVPGKHIVFEIYGEYTGTAGLHIQGTYAGEVVAGTLRKLEAYAPADNMPQNLVAYSCDNLIASGIDGYYIYLTGDGLTTLYGVSVYFSNEFPSQAGSNASVRFRERFISGQGNSGCRFASRPSYSGYSAALDKVGLSVDLVETWQ